MLIQALIRATRLSLYFAEKKFKLCYLNLDDLLMKCEFHNQQQNFIRK